MSSTRNPVGPLPPSVYRRRRLMVGLAVLAVIVIIVLIFVRPGSAEGEGDETAPTESTAETDAVTEPSVAPEPDTAEDGSCRPSKVTVEALLDKEAYGAGEQPQISMRFTNIGATPCNLDVTPTRQILEIGSGDDQYWVSSDCQAPADPLIIPLAPNDPQQTAAIAWDRTRSSPCDSSTQQVPAGDATYYLQVRLGEGDGALESPKKAFRLL
jgi:hypothetical protein